MDFKKCFDELLVADFSRVIEHLDTLKVARIAPNHLTIRGVLHPASHIAGSHLRHTVEFLQVILYTPEATSGKVGFSVAACQSVLICVKRQGNGIDTMSCIFGSKSFSSEDMPQMGSAS